MIIIKRWIVYVICFFLCSCVDSSPPNKEIKEFFIHNKESLQSFVNFCKDHPMIHRIKRNSDQYIQHYGKLSEDDQKLLEVRRLQLSDLGVISIQCARDGAIEGNPLIGLEILLFASPREAKGLDYLTGIAQGIKERIGNGELIPLSENGWYIFINNQ